MNLSWIFIILGAMMWGIDGVLLTPKYFTFGLYNVVLIVFVAHLIPLIILSIFNRNNYLKFKTFSRENVIYLLLISIFGGTLGTLSIVKALQLSEFNPYSLVVLIQKSQPIFAVLSAYIILKERPNKKFSIVFIISMFCLYVLTFGLHNPFELEYKSMLASLFSLIAAISFGISTTFSRKISLSLNSKTITFYRFLFTSLITFGLLLLTPKNSINDFKFLISSSNILILAGIISIWGLISSYLYYIGMKKTKAIYATICELAYPLTSLILDVVINHQVLEPIKLFSATLLIISILYLNFNNN